MKPLGQKHFKRSDVKGRANTVKKKDGDPWWADEMSTFENKKGARQKEKLRLRNLKLNY